MIVDKYIRDAIDATVKVRHTTYEKFAEKIGVSKSTMSRWLNTSNNDVHIRAQKWGALFKEIQIHLPSEKLYQMDSDHSEYRANGLKDFNYEDMGKFANNTDFGEKIQTLLKRRKELSKTIKDYEEEIANSEMHAVTHPIYDAKKDRKNLDYKLQDIFEEITAENTRSTTENDPYFKVLLKEFMKLDDNQKVEAISYFNKLGHSD